MYFLYTVNKTITFSYIAEVSWILPYDPPASSGVPLFFWNTSQKVVETAEEVLRRSKDISIIQCS